MMKIAKLVSLMVVFVFSFVIVAPPSVHAQVSAAKKTLSYEDVALLKKTLDALQTTLTLLEQRIQAGVSLEESQTLALALGGFRGGLVRILEITLALGGPLQPSRSVVVAPPFSQPTISVEDMVARDGSVVGQLSGKENQVASISSTVSTKKIIAIALVLAFVVGAFLSRRGTKSRVIIPQEVTSV